MPREKIVKDFAEWTAFSATRAGCPIRSRKDVYPLIRVPEYDKILYGDRITCEEFERWHETNAKAICDADSRLPVGWAVKLINVYLKTRVYLAREGRDGLIECIHPPIDNGLWSGIWQEYRKQREIVDKTHNVSRIKDIINYKIYKTIIGGCRVIAEKRGCLLIEVKELWQGTMTNCGNSQRVNLKSMHNKFKLIPSKLLDKACREIGNLPFPCRGITISRELIGITMEILNAETDKILPQNHRNDVRERTPDGLDRRIKESRNNDLRTANIISDVLANAGIVEIIWRENPKTGRIIKWTKLLREWCW